MCVAGRIPSLKSGKSLKLARTNLSDFYGAQWRYETDLISDRGFTIRRQTGNPWIVLHHVPPKTALDASGEEAEAAELLWTYRPQYFISGHSHQFPYSAGSSWAQRIGGVNVLVPGQILSAPFPNHIILNTESGQASWETSSQGDF
jgi:hypothetical protein